MTDEEIFGIEVEEAPPPKVEVGVLEPPTKLDVFLDLVADLAEEEGTCGVLRTWKGKKDYLGVVSAEVLTLAWVQENMGGGKYQFTARDGSNHYAGAVTVELAGTPKPWPPKEDPEESEIKELRSMMESLQGGNDSGSMDIFKMMISMMTMMNAQQKPLLEAMLARGEEKTTASELKALLDLVKDMAPAPGGGDPFDRVVAPLIPVLGNLLNQAGAMPATTNPTPTASAEPVAPQAPPGSEWVELFRPHLPQLQAWAAANKGTGVLASYTVAALEDQPSLPMILEQVGRGEAFLVEFFIFFPHTKPLEAWYRQFWADFQAHFKWDDVEEEEEEGVGSPEAMGPPVEAAKVVEEQAGEGVAEG